MFFNSITITNHNVSGNSSAMNPLLEKYYVNAVAVTFSIRTNDPTAVDNASGKSKIYFRLANISYKTVFEVSIVLHTWEYRISHCGEGTLVNVPLNQTQTWMFSKTPDLLTIRCNNIPVLQMYSSSSTVNNTCYPTLNTFLWFLHFRIGDKASQEVSFGTFGGGWGKG